MGNDHDNPIAATTPPTLREAIYALVDVIAYLHPNPNSPHAEKWAEWREAALDKAAAALEADNRG